MKLLCRISFALLALFGLTSIANAQMMFRTPDMHGIWNPVVGSGGSYEMSDPSGEKRQMDIFVVGKETIQGKSGYWLEMVMPNPKRGGEFIIKSLTVLEGSNGATYRVIMQMPQMPQPMEVTQQMLANQQSKVVDIRGSAEKVGSETITTPAGTFDCEHWRSNDGSDAWVTIKVAPYGLVKSVSKDGHTMILTRVITDAKDRITGTPVPFDPMHMMQQGRPQQ